MALELCPALHCKSGLSKSQAASSCCVRPACLDFFWLAQHWADRTLVAVFTWRSDGPVLVREVLVHNSFCVFWICYRLDSADIHVGFLFKCLTIVLSPRPGPSDCTSISHLLRKCRSTFLACHQEATVTKSSPSTRLDPSTSPKWNAHRDDVPGTMFTSRNVLSTSSCRTDADCLVPYIALTRCPHTLPSSVSYSSGTYSYVSDRSMADARPRES